MSNTSFRFISFFVILWLLVIDSATGQKFNFKHLTTAEGLSCNEVRAVFEDSNGFIWFATSDGLNCWDGYKFVVYKNYNNNENSLPTNSLLCIAEDGDKNIWIGTNHGGVVRYSTVHEKFYRYASVENDSSLLPGSVVRCIHSDADNSVWIGTHSGLARYDKQKDRFKIIRFSKNADVRYDIRAIFQRNSKELIIQSDKGFYKLNRSDETIEPMQFYAPDLDKNLFRYNNPVCFDSRGNLWIGATKGLYKLNLTTGESKKYQFDNSSGKSINSNNFSVIFEDSKKNLWVGTENKGVKLYHPGTDTFTSYSAGPVKSSSICNNIISNVYEDKNANVWFSTLEGGVSFFSYNDQFSYYCNDPLDANSISSNKIGAFYEDKNGFIWIGTEEGGLNKFNPQTESFERHTLNNSFIAPSILDLEPKDEHSLFISGLRVGLYDFNMTTGKFLNLMAGGSPHNWPTGHINDLTRDTNGNIWIAAHRKEGMMVYQPASGAFFDAETPGPFPKELLRIPYAVSVKEDSKKRLWIVTYIGLYMYDNSLHEYQSIIKDTTTLSSNYLYQLFEDSKKQLWVGSSKGLDRIVEKGGTIQFERCSQRYSLPDNVKGILEDSEGNLWLSSNQGITSFEPSSGKFRNFRINNELENQQMSERVCFKASDGQMYFGGTNGFLRFHPDHLKEITLPSRAAIVDFQIFNIPQKVGENSVLKKSIIYTDRIDLKYNQSVFSFEFAAMNMRKPVNIEYAYMLEGFDETWNFARDKRFATYTNLSPGEYIFRVKTTDGTQLSPGEGAWVRIIIHPPFWRTWFAWFLYFVILIVVLYFFRKSIINRERLKNELQREKNELHTIQEANIMKLRFFTNISHEFRTPLTLIKAPLEKLIHSGNTLQHEEQQVMLKLIQGNTNKLLGMVNQLLDYRKLEAGSLVLEPSEGDIVDFCRKCWSVFNLMAEQKNIRYIFQTSVDSQIISFDADKIDKIITNLLSNAFKYTHEGGQVTLSVEKLQGVINPSVESTHYMRIGVKDTGIGIPENELTKVFDRFYTVNRKGFEKFEGTGIGLTLVKELTELHHGQIAVTSKEKEGSVFEVKIPIVMKAKELIVAGHQNIRQAEPEKVTFTGDDIDRIIEGKPLRGKQESCKQKILVVEDDDELRMFLRNELIPDYEVIEAGNGMQGLDMAFLYNPDLILSDIMMPYMDGLELCKRIKSDERTSHVPVVLLSALHAQDKQIEGLEQGADDYIFKPFNLAILYSRIHNLLNTRMELSQRFKNNTSLKFENESANDQDRRLIQSIIDIVLENITNEKINADFISKKILISRSVIYIKVEALTGQSVNEFIRNIRLKKSTALLRRKDIQITEVAYAVGFSSQSYFTRCFTKRFGKSPKEWIADMDNRRQTKDLS
jgi:signal transduction histidine kinase/ligand-binding sensor domain-containing protein/DNA-binding response OmpR family regulator